MAERALTTKKLAELLRVSESSMANWRRNDQLPADDRDTSTGYYLYFHSNVDRWLASRTISGPPIRLADLLVYEIAKRKPSLLTPEEAAARLDCTLNNVWYHLRAGTFPGLTLSQRLRDGKKEFRSTRILATGLTAHIASLADDSLVGTQFTAGMLGAGMKTVETLVKEQKLESIRRGRLRLIRVDSLKALINTMVTPGTADDWWSMRIEYGFEPLLSFSEALAFCATSKRVLTPYIERREIPYLRLGAHLRIPQHALVAWKAARTPLSAAALGDIFGIDDQTVATLRNGRDLCGVKHPRGPHPCPLLPCVRWYIQAAQTSVFSIDDWFAWCWQDKMRPMLDQELLTTCPGSHNEDLREAIASARLRGVRLPTGEVAIARHDALAFRRIWLRSMAPGYHRRIDEV